MDDVYDQPDDATRRVRFFDGQFLQHVDFIDEQKYHLDRQRRLGRVLRVTGIAEGFDVVADPATPNAVRVTKGTAIDSAGRHLVLAADRPVELPGALFNDKQGVRLVALYREQATDLATTGSESERRWLEDPQVVAITAEGQATEAVWDDDLPTVLLALLRLDNRGTVTVDRATTQFAGLRVPGRVGVGTGSDAPAARLEVRGGAIRFGDGAGAGELIAGRDLVGIQDGARNTRLAILQSNGNVGIGTTTPGDFKLNVNGRVRLGTDNLGAATVLSVAPGTVQVDAPNVAGGRLHIDGGNGNVGVGTNNPGDFRLNVNGRTRLGANTDYAANVVLSVAPGTVQVDAPGVYGGRLVVDGATGRVGIGAPSPRSDIDMGKGVLTGAPNDYVKGQFTMSGGGTVTWGGPGQRLKWTQRFIAISAERGSTFRDGYVDIPQPGSPIPAANVYDGSDRPADGTGVVLKEWDALYAVHPVGGPYTSISFQVRQYTQSFTAPSNWLLVAVVNGDDRTVKLGTGTTLVARSTSTKGSPIPSGTIVMWSGATGTIPDGWGLCDGGNGTPDLRGRFVMGTDLSTAFGPGKSGEADTHTHRVDVPPSAGSTNVAGNHQHGFDPSWYYRTLGGGPHTAIDTASQDVKTALTAGAGGHAHTVTVDPQRFDSAAAAGNKPRWYALCFIMKLY